MHIHINTSDSIMNVLLSLPFIEKVYTPYSFNPLCSLNKVNVIGLQVYVFFLSIFLVIGGSRNIIHNFKMNI